jgi:hypothetical protein
VQSKQLSLKNNNNNNKTTNQPTKTTTKEIDLIQEYAYCKQS